MTDKSENNVNTVEEELRRFGETFEAIKDVPWAAKVYPNDPCPCGSGKKYKKCCGKMV